MAAIAVQRPMLFVHASCEVTLSEAVYGTWGSDLLQSSMFPHHYRVGALSGKH
jgi:hypothetical protein